MHETFWTLLRDPAHWEFELFLMLVFDGLIIGLLWPFVRVHWRHHIARDRAEAITVRDLRPVDWSLTQPGHVKDPWTTSEPWPPSAADKECWECDGVIIPLENGVQICKGCGDVRCTPQEGGQ